MHPREVRIGNLVLMQNENGNFHDVWEIGNADEIEMVIYRRPIKMTKKWLIDFGFKRSYFNPKENKESYKIRGDKEFVVQVYGKFRVDPTLKSHVDWFTVGYDKGYVEINYVHQLQNLYFALTGEELFIT